jgi:hypothetical protein
MYLADDGRYLLFASAAGVDRSPAWYWNLIANPDASIEVGDEHLDVHAVELSGAEREVRRSGRAVSAIRRIPAHDVADHPSCRTHADRRGEAALMKAWGIGAALSDPPERAACILKKVTRRSIAAADLGNPAEINTGQTRIPCRRDSNATLTSAAVAPSSRVTRVTASSPDEPSSNPALSCSTSDGRARR